MECCYCHEKDESKLTISTRNVNGKVETIDICLSCSWRDEFIHEAKGDGNALREERERAGNKTVSVGSLDFPALREGAESGR